MFGRKSIQDIISQLQTDPNFKDQIIHWETLPEQEAKFAQFPTELHPKIVQALNKKQIQQLYTHQLRAYEAVKRKEHITLITPTASGKTLCYNLPILQTMMEDQHARAMYIFPTKALAQDQKSELNELIDEGDLPISSDTYDGDTPANIRQKVRKAGNIVITNPDMLHSGILPHHTKWVSLFENLKYIVIDELHIYRGVFGSHVANVIRRLKRICRFYGANPIFICTSATIANPVELSESLIGEQIHLINENGAPSGKKHFVFYNPPITNQKLNIRKSATLEVSRLAEALLKESIQTIVFARSRVRVEIILTYLQEIIAKKLRPKSIRGYRGGYLPTERREIEKGLRSGEIYGVVSTNALELGVDIGQLEACIMTGYPGTIASAWQQAGRAGRKHGESLVMMVASSSGLDQYIISNPDYFFKQTPETARINPENLIILIDHIKCAAYELPFQADEQFGKLDLEEILHYLTEERVLHQKGNKWYWMNDAFPAHNISLRSAAQDNVIIINRSVPSKVQVLGEMDIFSAMTLLHEEAIYLHQGIQYQVEELDWEEKKAYVAEVAVDYYTDANLAVQLKVLEEDKEKTYNTVEVKYGDVSVTALATIFKKIRMKSHENIGSGHIHLPEMELHTSSAWLSFEKDCLNIEENQLEYGLIGIANVLQSIIPLFVMCDSSDIQTVPQMKASHNEKPTVFVYDKYPGGIGLSEEVFKQFDLILQKSIEFIKACPCQTGCPSCVGVDSESEDVKQTTLILLSALTSIEPYKGVE